MEANEFVNKLKASGGTNDFTDLPKCFEDYKKIVAKLQPKDRISFSLNVLCILCRNLEKVASWRDAVSVKDLLALSIDCVRETRPADRPERVKALACVCHLHKFAVRQSSPVPPELLLKLSYMLFEPTTENLLSEHSKTYWNILAERTTYLEKLKAERQLIVKLLPKLLEDCEKILKVCDSVKFCQLVMVFLVKKLYYLFSDGHAKELNNAYKVIFDSLAVKTDLKNFKKLSDKESMEIYIKFNECFYTVMENSSKTGFKDSIFYDIVRVCISVVGHKSDLFHCLQTFYLNTFCNLLAEKLNTTFTETILNGMVVSCKTTEKLSYKDAMMATYPFIYQLLRLYMEHTIGNGEARWKEVFSAETQESCLNLVLFLMTKLKDTNQMLKCDNCTVKTGLHDALRLSFPIKSIISISLSQEMDLTAVLPVYYSIIEKQHDVLSQLEALHCRNHQKCLQKAQTDIHNTAILLHKAKNYEFSIKTFDLFLKQEISLQKSQNDLKNISRGLYNKAICELDSKQYEESLRNAYLSFLFSQPEGLNSEKHMSLVIDIKAKALKDRDANESEDISQDRLQLLTVKDVYATCLVTDLYGDLKAFFNSLKLSQLLKHEFTIYAKSWPSIVPISGIWVALYDMLENGLPAEDQSSVLAALYDVILETPHVVRTIHNDHFRTITLGLLDKLESLEKNEKVDKLEKKDNKVDKAENQKAQTEIFSDSSEKIERNLERMHKKRSEEMRKYVLDKLDSKKADKGEKKVDKKADTAEKKADKNEKNVENIVMHATLLFLKTEFDLAEASVEYGWKNSEPSTDPDLCLSRTVPQEHSALQAAASAVQRLTSGLVQLLQRPRAARVPAALRQWLAGVPLLLAAGRRAAALQLAHVICQLAELHQDSETYIVAAGTILSHAQKRNASLERLLHQASLLAERLLADCGTQKTVTDGGTQRTVVDGGGMETALVFVCEAAIYTAACGNLGAAAMLVQYAQARISEAAETRPDLNLGLAVGRLLDALCALCAGAGPGAVVRAQRHYLTIANTGSQWAGRRLRSLYTALRGTQAGLLAAARCRALLLWRRARSAASAALQLAAAVDAARLLATVTCVHKTDEAHVKIDNRLKYILGLHPSNETQSHEPIPELKLNASPNTRNAPLETMLDAQTFRRTQVSPSIPCITVPGFKMPEFMTHTEECACYACQTPFCLVLACQTAGLEASVYFRAKEFAIAKHYYCGVFKMFSLVEQKLQHITKAYKKMGFEEYVLEIVEKFYKKELQKVQVEIFIEAAFFELSQENYTKADEFIVKIGEIMQHMPDVDQYVQSEVMNLMCASAYMRKIIKTPDSDETSLETELENLKLSPTTEDKPLEIQKTPNTKAEKPPKLTRSRVVVKDEDLPHLKRKVIKLNLDDAEESTSAKPAARKTRFKIPVPITNKPVPETITPVTKAKSRPKIIVSQPTIDLPSAEDLATPIPKKTQEKPTALPHSATPSISEDAFFTPQTSMKTYAKKSVRKDIVKNLDQEFSASKAEEKENTTGKQRSRRKVETGSLRSLQRSTSPGNLDDNPLNKRLEPVRQTLRNQNTSDTKK